MKAWHDRTRKSPRRQGTTASTASAQTTAQSASPPAPLSSSADAGASPVGGTGRTAAAEAAAPPAPSQPLRRTPLSRLVDAAGRARTSTRALGQVTLGHVALIVAGLALLIFAALSAHGLGSLASAGAACIFVGISIGWTQMTLIMNAADAGHPRARDMAMAAGSMLVAVAGVVAVCAAFMPWEYVARGLLSGVLLVIVLAVIIAPWWLSLVADLGKESARAAAEELRADYATRLHDSVLQTLALIQLDADDPVRTRALARAQERDLREWLYGDPGAVRPAASFTAGEGNDQPPMPASADGPEGRSQSAPASQPPAHPGAGNDAQPAPTSHSPSSSASQPTPASRIRSGAQEDTPDSQIPELPTALVAFHTPAIPASPATALAPATLSRAVKQAAATVEDALERPIDVVVVGDARMTPVLAGMVAAAQEAMRNAARHGAPPIAVYAEVSDSQVEIFVRDHGVGFDPEHLPAGHRGVRDSIIGRMEKLGGTAHVDSRPGWGTEIHLALPL